MANRFSRSVLRCLLCHKILLLNRSLGIALVTIVSRRVWQAGVAWSIICLSLLFATFKLFGQTPISQMYHRSWTVRDGFPNGIEDAAQGADGFLWFTTNDGLYRFDGVTFERYVPPSGSQLISDRMNRIIVTHDGAIWISYLINGVTRIKGNQITNFTEKDGLRPGHTGGMAEDKDGRVWVVGSQGLQFIRDNRVVLFSDTNGDGTSFGENIVVDHEGNLWTSESGVKVLERGSRDFVVASKGQYFGCIPAQDSGVLCLGRKVPLMQFMLRDSKPIGRELMHDPPVTAFMLAARDGTVWLSTLKLGIQRFANRHNLALNPNNPQLETFGRELGLSGENADILIEDREGSVWAITNRGLDQFRPAVFRQIPIDEPYQPNIALLANHATSQLYVGTTRVSKVADGGLSYLTGALKSNARCIYQGDDGTVWIGTNQGLQTYRNGELKDVPLGMGDGDNAPIVSTVVEDSDHRIWAQLGGHGLYRLDKQGWNKRGGLTGLPEAVAFAALRDHTGSVWFGFRKGILARVSSGKVSRFDSSNGLDLGDIRVLTERKGAVWAGGDKGIAVFDHGSFRHFALGSGEQLRGVSGLVFLSNGDLWINSSSGVFQVTQEELSRWDQKADYLVQWRLFDYLDGLDGIPEAFSGNPTAAVAPDGLLYVTVASTLQWADPMNIARNVIPPQVWITRIETAQGSKAFSDEVRLQPDTRGLEISYTASSLLIPERVRFRYQLVGFDKDWIDAGTRRQAFYAKVPAGKYQFRVVASNDSGVSSSVPTTVNITVAPTWIETVWFKVVVAASLAALIYLGFLLRMRNVKRRLTERLTERFSERERIARDLHDTLFQGVEGGLLHINAVTSRIPMEPEAKIKLHGAFNEVNQVMASARNLIFDQSKSDESLEFEGIIVAYGEQVGLLSESQFSVITLGIKRELRSSVRNELLKIIKEGLSNAFRHANAKKIEVQVAYTRHALEIRVCDDGVGIDPIIIEEGGKRGHWGLSGMRQRANEIDAQLKVLRRAGGGTEVRLKIPASRAFRPYALEVAAKWLRWNTNRTDLTA